MSDPLRLAIIGCGAITEQGHLLGLKGLEEWKPELLIDVDASRASEMAKEWNVPAHSSDYRDIVGRCDAAIIATPHHFHAEPTVALLNAGVHVLVEKPMATTVADCERMCVASETSGSLLAVGMIRRFFWSNRFLKHLIATGSFGAVKRFEIEDGGVYAWPSASRFIVNKEHSGGGVLIGNGSHVMDMVIWLFGEPTDFEYETDAEGGIETDCALKLQYSHMTGRIELSRTRALKNHTYVEFEHGTMTVPLYGNSLEIHCTSSDLVVAGGAKDLSSTFDAQDLPAIMSAQLQDFSRAIRNSVSPAVTGREATRSIKLIEAAYEKQVGSSLQTAWMRQVVLND